MLRPPSPPKKIISVRFYRSSRGSEPVREWLISLTKTQKRIIGGDIKTVELGWPLGMPVVKPLGKKLWEIRSSFPNGIARVIFTIRGDEMILLHGFIKKSTKTPKKDLELAISRAKEI